MRDNTVVGATQRPSKLQYHALLMAGLARAAAKLGKGGLADRMDLSGPGLDKVYAGSMPCAKRQWDLLDHEPTALDDVAAAYGKRIVPADAVCSTDAKAGPVMVQALSKIVQAEADGALDHRELLDMEPELRAARAAMDTLIARCHDIRGVVSLPVMGRVA